MTTHMEKIFSTAKNITMPELYSYNSPVQDTCPIDLVDNSLNEDEYYIRVRILIDKIISLFLFILGTIGNVLIIITMRRKKLFLSTIAVYLIALAVFDTCVLIFDNFVTWFDLMTTSFSIQSITKCKINYVFYVARIVSAWIIVLISLNRALSVVQPFKFKFLIKRWYSYTSITVILIIAIVFEFYYLFAVTSPLNDDFDCIPVKSSISSLCYTKIWPILEALFYSIVPSIILFVANSIIVMTTNRKIIGKKGKSKCEPFKKMNLIVITVCFSFTIFTLPSSLFDILYRSVWNLIDEVNKHTIDDNAQRTYILKTLLFSRLLDLLANTVHAVNFILYILTANEFRNEFLLMFNVCFKKINFKYFRSTKVGVTTVSDDSTAPVFYMKPTNGIKFI